MLLLTGALVAPVSRAWAESAPPTSAKPETGLGIRLLEGPRDKEDDPRSHVYVIDHVGPGTSLSRRIQVANDTDRPMHVRLYVGSARIEKGQFTVDDGHGTGRLPSWGHIEPAEADVAARGTTDARLVIAVPRNAPDGEVYGVALAEPVVTPQPGAQLTIVTRVGIRIYLSVGSGAEPKSDFVVSTLTAGRDADGKPVVDAQVRNIGDRALDMSGELRLSDGPGGISAGPFPARLGITLRPRQSAPVHTVLDPALPLGPWKATLTLRSGLIEHGVEATLTFPSETAVGVSGPTVTASEVRAPGRRIAVPIAIAALLLALAALFRQLLRRRTDDEPAATA